MNNIMTFSGRCSHGALSPCFGQRHGRPGGAGRLQGCSPGALSPCFPDHPAPRQSGAATAAERLPRRRRSGAFTLIELLVVMLVIVVLAGIVFKAGRVLQERGKIQQAKADIARLAMALERYYTDRGCYPPPDGNFVTTRDLEYHIGWVDEWGFEGAPILWLFLDEDCTYRRDRRSYISGWPKDRLGTMPLKDDTKGGTVVRYYKDPWGNPYKYCFYSGVGEGTIERRGAYFVASAGPNGVRRQGAKPEADDIWAGTAEPGGEQMGR